MTKLQKGNLTEVPSRGALCSVGAGTVTEHSWWQLLGKTQPFLSVPLAGHKGQDTPP